MKTEQCLHCGKPVFDAPDRSCPTCGKNLGDQPTSVSIEPSSASAGLSVEKPSFRCESCGKEIPPGQEKHVFWIGGPDMGDPPFDLVGWVCPECVRARRMVWVILIVALPALVMMVIGLWFLIDLLGLF